MTDIILDQQNDITFSGDDFNLFSEDDNSLVAQRLELKLRSYLGEWFRDINYGIPWQQSILSKTNTKSLADTYIKNTIYQDVDIKSIKSYTSFSREAILYVTFTAILQDGSTATINLEL